MTTTTGHQWSWRAIIFGAVCSVIVGTPFGAWADHPSSTARVGDNTTWRSASSLGSAVPLPRLTTGLVYGTRYFGRLLEGASSYERAELGSVSLNTLSLQAALELKSRTLFGVNAPVGLVNTKSPSGENSLSGGLGDIELHVAQELISLFGEDVSPFSMILHVGLVMPTGHYEPGGRLSVTDISGSSDGAINVFTYNAQTSLGADSWSPFAGLGMRWQGSRRVAVFVEATMLTSATRTRDNIRWGTDLSARASTAVEIIEDRVSLIANVDYRHHFQDEVPVTGSAGFDDTGGRDEVAAGLGADVGISDNLVCSISVRAPVWQHVGGIQLVETVSGTAGCTVFWGF